MVTWAALRGTRVYKTLLVALLYYASAQFTNLLVFIHIFEHVEYPPFWLPSGLAFAMVLIYGPQVWLGIALGSLALVPLSSWYESESLFSPIFISFMMALGRVVEPLVGYYFLKNDIKTGFLSSIQASYRFVFYTFLISVIGTTVSLVGINIVTPAMRPEFFTHWVTWYLDNLVGILLFTPFVLGIYFFRFNTDVKLETKAKIEYLLIFLSWVLFFSMYNSAKFEKLILFSAPFLILPFLSWLAYQFQFLLVAVVSLCVSFFAAYITTWGYGPFAVMGNVEDSALLLQVFIMVMSVNILIMYASAQQGRLARAELNQWNEDLEVQVSDRTTALMDEIKSRKLYEEKLQQANTELVKRNTELDNFTYSVSHDIRAPIASILGLLNLAEKDESIQGNEYYPLIKRSAKQLDDFIQEVLSQSKNTRMEVSSELISFRPLIEEVFNQVNYISEDQPIRKTIEVSQESEFYTDKWRLKVILNNLISNSVRYRTEQNPWINVRVQVEMDKATIEVEDNGKGIDKHHLPKVFNMFYRASDKATGSGLGLYIVKEALEKLKGTVAIESEPNVGTKVTIMIPQGSKAQ